ncbi:hypothetical protein SRHO_G00174530 [Serrasalmus rhombeus]
MDPHRAGLLAKSHPRLQDSALWNRLAIPSWETSELRSLIYSALCSRSGCAVVKGLKEMRKTVISALSCYGMGYASCRDRA